jgi:hypothetical protein
MPTSSNCRVAELPTEFLGRSTVRYRAGLAPKMATGVRGAARSLVWTKILAQRLTRRARDSACLAGGATRSAPPQASMQDRIR